MHRFGTTEVVPCYKHERLKFFRGLSSPNPLLMQLAAGLKSRPYAFLASPALTRFLNRLFPYAFLNPLCLMRLWASVTCAAFLDER
jgi:hypothetical protein